MYFLTTNHFLGPRGPKNVFLGPVVSQGSFPWGSQGGPFGPIGPGPWADGPWAMGRWALWADWPFGPGPMGPGPRAQGPATNITWDAMRSLMISPRPRDSVVDIGTASGGQQIVMPWPDFKYTQGAPGSVRVGSVPTGSGSYRFRFKKI